MVCVHACACTVVWWQLACAVVSVNCAISIVQCAIGACKCGSVPQCGCVEVWYCVEVCSVAVCLLWKSVVWEARRWRVRAPWAALLASLCKGDDDKKLMVKSWWWYKADDDINLDMRRGGWWGCSWETIWWFFWEIKLLFLVYMSLLSANTGCFFTLGLPLKVQKC